MFNYRSNPNPMKGLRDKSVICGGCKQRYTIMFKLAEEFKTTVCQECGRVNTHPRPKGKKKEEVNP
jgi:NMD protein affecting ribosome stability and mRNA decay